MSSSSQPIAISSLGSNGGEARPGGAEAEKKLTPGEIQGGNARKPPYASTESDRPPAPGALAGDADGLGADPKEHLRNTAMRRRPTRDLNSRDPQYKNLVRQVQERMAGRKSRYITVSGGREC